MFDRVLNTPFGLLEKTTLLRANQTHKIPRKSLSKKALAQNYSNLILRIQE